MEGWTDQQLQHASDTHMRDQCKSRSPVRLFCGSRLNARTAVAGSQGVRALVRRGALSRDRGTPRCRRAGRAAGAGYPDLRTAELEIYSADRLPDPHEDFTLTRPGCPALSRYLTDVQQAERLREVRALVGFTRLDAPDPDDPELVETAPPAKIAAGLGGGGG